MTVFQATVRPSGALPRYFAAIVVILGVLAGSLAFRDHLDAYGTPLTEDGFYALAVARSIAAGHGMTIDGVNPTNGFQPLFTFIEAGCYWIADGHGVTAVRLMFGISVLIYLAAGLLLGSIAASAGDPAHAPARRWLATALYLGGFLTFMHHFNGLETGLVALVYAALWRMYQQGWMEGRWGPALFGVVCGILVLTRIDAAVFVAVFAFWQFLRSIRTDPRRALLRAAQIGGIALLISSPWWIYNYTVFGSVMPTSGTAQSGFALDERRLRWVFWAFGVTAMPTLWLGRFDEMFHDGILLSALRAVIAVALLVWLRRALEARRPWAARDAVWTRTVEFGLVLGAALILLALYYGLTFIAYWFYYRYLFPTALLATVAIAWVAAPLAARHAAAAAVVVALLAMPTAISAMMAQQGKTLHVETVYWEQLALIEGEVPRDAAVAAGQAGTLGYFRPNVVNVDGKVNRDVIPFQKTMWEYLRANDVVWFCDWPFYVEKYLGPDPGANGWSLVATRGAWQLWHRAEDTKPTPDAP